MRTTGFIGGIVLSVLAYSADAANLSNCNFSAFDTEAVVVAQEESGFKMLAGIRMPAGTCNKVSLSQYGQDHLYYYIRALETPALRHLQRESWFREDWNGWPVWTSPEFEYVICISERDGSFEEGTFGALCNGRLIGLDRVTYDQNGDFFIDSTDPFLCARRTGVDCWSELEPVLTWAYLLNRSLISSKRSFEMEDSNRYYGVIPTAVGWEAVDFNGPYQIGVEVTFAHSRTPFGSDIYVRKGDQIIEFNGEPVFDRNDLVYYIVEHGLRHGFENPHQVVVRRGSELLSLVGYQVFHRDVYGSIFQNSDGSCRNSGAASLTGALREGSFYTSDILGCIHFDREHGVVRNRSCEFIVRQVVAAYRQYCPDETYYSTIIGGVFLPGRQIPESVMKRFIFKGTGAAPRILRAIALEGAEEAARTVLTLPPGIKAADNLDLVRKQAALAASIGVGFTVAFPRITGGR